MRGDERREEMRGDERREEMRGDEVEVLQYHQYSIRTDGSGRLTTRNRRFLRRYSPHKTEDVPLIPHFPLPNAPHPPAALPSHTTPEPNRERLPEAEPPMLYNEPEPDVTVAQLPPACPMPARNTPAAQPGSPPRSYASVTRPSATTPAHSPSLYLRRPLQPALWHPGPSPNQDPPVDHRPSPPSHSASYRLSAEAHEAQNPLTGTAELEQNLSRHAVPTL